MLLYIQTNSNGYNYCLFIWDPNKEWIGMALSTKTKYLELFNKFFQLKIAGFQEFLQLLQYEFLYGVRYLFLWVCNLIIILIPMINRIISRFHKNQINIVIYSHSNGNVN